MSEYTVQIDASTADGRIWQVVEPAETVDTDDPNTVAYQATDAAEVAQAIAGHQIAVTGDSWRVRVWPGADADTGTEPAAVVNPGQPAVTYTAWPPPAGRSTGRGRPYPPATSSPSPAAR